MKNSFSTATTVNLSAPSKRSFIFLLSITFIATWLVLFFNCIDTTDWFIENILVFIFAILISTTYRRFQFSDISYLCFFLFLLFHIFGAQYAYTKNPLGAWFQETYHLWRNPYDRIVHFSFGFFLCYPLREALKKNLNVKGRWQYILPVEITLSLACIFELIEWTVAEVTDKVTGETYVATQGDVWDAHKDIVLALLGASITMFAVYLYNRKKIIVTE